jgi:hypothetical protein
LFLSRKVRTFFPEFNIRLYDKNSESDYYFFPPPKSEYFVQQHWELEVKWSARLLTKRKKEVMLESLILLYTHIQIYVILSTDRYASFLCHYN